MIERRPLRYLLTLCLLAWSGLLLAAQELVLGVFPYVTPGQLVQFHSPLRQLLADTLQRPVSLVTAPDFKTFVQRTREGQYDIILTAPHMGRLAETRDGYQRIAATGHEVQGIILVKRDAPYQKVEDLAGKNIMMAQRISILYQLTEKYLRDHGLVPGKNIQVIETRTHNNAMYAPLRGEAEAAMTGTVLWQAVGDEFKGKMRPIGSTDRQPGFLLMGQRNMSQTEIAKLRAAVMAFADTPQGREYFQLTKFKSFHDLADTTMRGLDPYVTILLE